MNVVVRYPTRGKPPRGYVDWWGSHYPRQQFFLSPILTNVLSIDNARIAINTLNSAIDRVHQERSYLGSVQNKLQFTMSNLTSQTQSIEAARSRIQDTDFAADAADLAKNQILAQSATAMLAQASAIPQNILSLIAA